MNIKNILTLILLLTSIISHSQGQKTSKKAKSTSTTLYFTVINWIYLANTNPNEKERKINEDDLEPANYQSANKYFQGILFYSTKVETRLQFEAFLTINEVIRKKEFFHNSDSISNFFHKKYSIGFFYDAEYEKAKALNNEWSKTFGKLERFITLEDFSRVIVPNLKLKLIEPIDITEITKQAKYTLAYNWDFYEEGNLPPLGMNILMKFIPDIPVKETLHSNEVVDLQYASLSNLDVVTYYPDSKVKGLVFSESDLKKYKCSELKYSFVECSKTISGFEVWPNTRNFATTYKSQYENNSSLFSKHYDLMLNFFSQKIKPFTILNAKL